MKTKTKGLIVAIFFGTILLTSTITIGLTGSMTGPADKLTITGTPEDNFPDIARPQYCGTGNAKSTEYITEYKIPTKCTMPLAVTVDDVGNVWFAQTNTGMIAKFDPVSRQFTEYENPEWPEMARTMMWGMDYADGNIWYTDDVHDTVWKFSTVDGTYEPVGFPASDESLPQHLKITDRHVIVNDFYGGKISFLDLTQDRTYLNVPSPISGSFTGGFDIDSTGNIWYTNWMLRQGGALVKFDYGQFASLSSVPEGSATLQFSDVFNLPPDLGTAVGLTVDKSDNIWIADTSSSSFFKFDPISEQFIRYVTSDADPSTYGNHTGVIRSPITGPYWIEDDGDRIMFNEQMGNAIAVFDTVSESLIEYHVPSMNPNWFDCQGSNECGIAQVFGFKPAGDKIWFTEWVENNIGVVDLSVPLPVDVQVSQTAVSMQRGQSVTVDLHLVPTTSTSLHVLSKTTSAFGDIKVDLRPQTINLREPMTIPVSITSDGSALPGMYKVLFSARSDGVTVSQFVTVNITS